jgi:malate-CoA ligase subunit alpha
LISSADDLCSPLNSIIFASDYMSKPVVAYIAGLTAPEGRRMGHAGAIISCPGESAAEKVTMLKDLGITICPTPSAIGETVAAVLSRM